jgi:hypothetical protein
VRPAIEALRILEPKIKQDYIDAVCYSKAPVSEEETVGSVPIDMLEKLLEARGLSVS